MQIQRIIPNFVTNYHFYSIFYSKSFLELISRYYYLLMKKNILFIIGVLFFSIAASAQVKTFKTVVEDEKIVVNASDCVDRLSKSYLLWVRYDYKNKKDCKKDAKRDDVTGKPTRVEVLYEFDEPLLTYRIVSKKYYDKNDIVLKEKIYHNAPWNQVGDFDYSLKLGIYMTGAFHIVAG